jgi:predicted enzyme related to lactoylglutathione lyase
MPAHHKIDYVEFSACDIPASKAFFECVFGWIFEDFGAEYAAFANAGIEGGFFANNAYSRTEHGSALIVLYSDDLEQSYADIVAAGGIIAKPIFAFPGGRRFHFFEPSGNELAIWSDVSR